MGLAKIGRLLAFSAILAWGSTLGWTKPAPPERPSQHGAQERVPGKADRAAPEQHGKGASGEDGRGESEDRGRETQGPARPATEEASPAREEKSDCDDCVIVLPETSGQSDGKTAGSSGMSGAGHLAGTLWGLFMVARPRRLPRTIIRGVTVP